MDVGGGPRILESIKGLGIWRGAVTCTRGQQQRGREGGAESGEAMGDPVRCHDKETHEHGRNDASSPRPGGSGPEHKISSYPSKVFEPVVRLLFR